MSLKPTSSGVSRRTLLVTGALLPIAAPATAQAQLPAGDGFSFAAVGDIRPMMYLPLKEGQPDLSKFFVEMFGLVMPEKLAEDVVAEGCEDDLRSGHKGPDQGRHAVRIQDGSDDPDGR